MSRPAKFWFRKQNATYYVNLGGKQVNLGKDKDKAEKEFHRLKSLELPTVTTSAPLAVELFDKFLDWTAENRANGTSDWYTKHIQSFIDSLPNQRILADSLKPHHVTEWVKASWSKTYARGAMIALQRAMKWSVTQGYISKSPIANLEKPSAERRDNCPTKVDFEEMLKHANGSFEAVLEFVWETGCRPQEVVMLEARHLKGDTLELMVSESKGKKSKRVIYLTDKAKRLTAIKLAKSQDNLQFIFVNRNGSQWTAYALDCGMKRIAKKTGKKFSFYDLRHGFATRMLEAGIDHVTLAALMGHKDAAMICRVYSHVGQNSARLLEKLKSVQ